MTALDTQTTFVVLIALVALWRRSWEHCADAEIVEHVLQGHVEAYKTLVRRYEQRIYAVARRMTRTHEDADDVSQEAFVRAYQSLGTFDTSRQFYTWLCRIAMNLAINLGTKDRKRATNSLDECREATGFEAASTASTSAETEYDELSAAVEKALSTLPEGMREVFVLRTFDDMSYDEIAETLSLPRGTVMSRLARARERVQTALLPFVADEVDREPGE